MRIRVHEENINTKEHFEEFYSNPNWRAEWDGADKRLEQAMGLIKQEYKKHLDIGCADGTFTKYYLAKYPETEGWGVDISEKAVDLASNNCPKGHFQAADAYTLPFADKTFDLVHSAETLEHLDYPEKAVAEAYRVLKLGGTFIVTVPNEHAAEYEEHLWKWNAAGVRQIIKSVMTKDSLHGFKIVEERKNFFNGHIYYVRAEKI